MMTPLDVALMIVLLGNVDNHVGITNQDLMADVVDPTTQEEVVEESKGGGWELQAPAAGSDPDAEPTRAAFPENGRVDYQSTPDLGSGGAQSKGNTNDVRLALQAVTVLPFTMSAASVSGGVVFVPTTGGPTGGLLAFWISTSQDGDAVSGACAHKGGYEGKMSISTQASAGVCVLQAGGQYYLNVATCISGDYACRSGAETAYEPGRILMAGAW